MSDCFCGCGRSVGTFGHRAKANRLGGKLTKAVPMVQGALVRVPEFAGDAEIERLAADGPRRVAEVRAYVHEERGRDLLDADGINAWWAAWRQRYAEFLQHGTDGWIGLNPMKLGDLLLAGERGTATIQEVRDTGMTVNDDPRVELRLWITPERGAAFGASRKVVVSRLSVPQRGMKLPVVFDPQDHDRFTFRREDLQPGRARFEATAPAPSLEKAAAASTGDGETDAVARLTKLAELHAAGALTDDEFATAKAQVLAGG